jgi:hypothetical protein
MLVGGNRPVSFVYFCEFSPFLPPAYAPAPARVAECQKLTETHKTHTSL